MINAIDHELTGAINHAEIELHETTMGGREMVEKREESWRKAERSGFIAFCKSIYEERNGRKRKKRHARVYAMEQWHN